MRGRESGWTVNLKLWVLEESVKNTVSLTNNITILTVGADIGDQ